MFAFSNNTENQTNRTTSTISKSIGGLDLSCKNKTESRNSKGTLSFTARVLDGVFDSTFTCLFSMQF